MANKREYSYFIPSADNLPFVKAGELVQVAALYAIAERLEAWVEMLSDSYNQVDASELIERMGQVMGYQDDTIAALKAQLGIRHDDEVS